MTADLPSDLWLRAEPESALSLSGCLALLGLLAVAACGLTPVYGPDGAGRRLFGRIRPQDPETFEDFAFNRRLAERLGPEADGALQLEYRLSIGVVSQAITPEEVTTRYSLNGTADFALRDAAGVVLVQGRVSGLTSYSTTRPPSRP